MTNPAPTTPTTDADRAAAVARPRVQARHRGTGHYPVTVGGYVIGVVDRHGDEWHATDDDGTTIPGGFTSRREAVAELARSTTGAAAYRDAAIEGTFGTREKARVLLELDIAPTPAPEPTPASPSPLQRHRVERRNSASPLGWAVVDPDGQTVYRSGKRSTAQEEADRLDALRAAPCSYFAACDRPAVGTLPNPILGPVPTCQRCADTVDAGDRVTLFAGAS